jgi:hypothetical protein
VSTNWNRRLLLRLSFFKPCFLEAEEPGKARVQGAEGVKFHRNAPMREDWRRFRGKVEERGADSWWAESYSDLSPYSTTRLLDTDVDHYSTVPLFDQGLAKKRHAGWRKD